MVNNVFFRNCQVNLPLILCIIDTSSHSIMLAFNNYSITTSGGHDVMYLWILRQLRLCSRCNRLQCSLARLSPQLYKICHNLHAINLHGCSCDCYGQITCRGHSDRGTLSPSTPVRYYHMGAVSVYKHIMYINILIMMMII